MLTQAIHHKPYPRRMLLVLLLLAGLMLLSIPAAAQTSAQVVTTNIAFQEYQGGTMIWREDTGTVYVMFHPPAWNLITFPQSSYENLPDNPITEEPPGEFVRPVNAFKLVWANNPDVRTTLGWPFDYEEALVGRFGPTSTTAGGISQFKASFAEQDFVFRADGTWGFHGLPRPISSLPAESAFPASVQAFEGGYMMYWSETGTIIVMEDDGSYQLHESHTYGALPDNPIRETPPAGMRKPILGFGQVWGNRESVRATLGWATAAEDSYRMSFERTITSGGNSRVAFLVSFPDGCSVTLRDNGTWVFVG